MRHLGCYTKRSCFWSNLASPVTLAYKQGCLQYVKTKKYIKTKKYNTNELFFLFFFNENSITLTETREWEE
jgi:hypothetical protein